MAKVIATIAAENGMSVDEIVFFKTENYIGLYAQNYDDFMLMAKTSIDFNPQFVGYKYGLYSDLQEFDDKIFEMCEEHISEVFDIYEYYDIDVKEN